jgi:intein/homing endonuclease
MMPDGSLIKDLRRIYFHQEKDFRKIIQFKQLLEVVFSPSNKIFIRRGHGTYDVYTNSKTLAHFFYYILKIRKSDEETRIPEWLFNSPESVRCAYLREAFDMEAYVAKNLREIRFITVDKNYAIDLQKLLLTVGINSHVKDRIGGTHRTIQYRISIYSKSNFLKFSKIGFSIPLHEERFSKIMHHCNKKI